MPAQKAPAQKTPPKTAPAQKTAPKKPAQKKAAVKKATAKKAAAKKPPAQKQTRALRAEPTQALHGHPLRNHNLRLRSLARSASAPPLGQKAVEIRVCVLNLTRIQMAKDSGVSRGALRDLELGVHTPTRLTMERFLEYCDRVHVPAAQVEAVRSLYAGPCDTLQHIIGRMELKAGSSPELARKIGIAPATLWEYKRGHFPVPYPILKKLCAASDEDFTVAEALWHVAERKRFLERGFPESLAELCILRLRSGHAESKLLELGLLTSQLKRLCYLELPAWTKVSAMVKTLCRTDDELKHMREIWQRDFQEQKNDGLHVFGLKLKKLREKLGVERREVSDLFLVGGKKPARTIKHIEEDGHYSQLAFPAGLVALLTDYEKTLPASQSEKDALGVTYFLQTETAKELRDLWEQRRIRFHLRHRPEMRLDLRLEREYYGFDVPQAAKILGYTSLEYQKVERGIETITDSSNKRILAAYKLAGHRRVAEVFQRRIDRDVRRLNWQSPTTVADMLLLLAEREGGVVTLSRVLQEAKLYGTSTPQVRGYIDGLYNPTWYLMQQIADWGGVTKLGAVHLDWIQRYRAHLKRSCKTMLLVELKLLMFEVSPTMRDFSKRLKFNCSALLRDLYRIEDGELVKWPHIERILRAAGLPDHSERWQVIHRLWTKRE